MYLDLIRDNHVYIILGVSEATHLTYRLEYIMDFDNLILHPEVGVAILFPLEGTPM